MRQTHERQSAPALTALIGAIIVFGALSLGMVLYSQWLSNRDFTEVAALARLSTEIQRELTMSHLQLEEAIAGDTSIELGPEVIDRISRMRDRIEAIVREGAPGALSGDAIDEVRGDFESLGVALGGWLELVSVRWEQRDSDGAVGGRLDQTFDLMFTDLIDRSTWIAAGIEAHIAADQRKILLINLTVVLILLTLFSAVAVLMVRYRKATGIRAAALEDLVRERTARLRAREEEALLRNRELAAARDEAKAASEAKSQFLARMSHEIRTPMNGLIGMVSLLARTELSAEQREYVETMEHSGWSLLEIINEILDFSKIEANKMTLANKDFGVRSWVREILQLFSVEAERKNLRLKASIDPEVPGTLRADAVRLGQILSNLVSNAIKFSRDGDVEISCRLADDQPDDGQLVALRFEVKDCGQGISEDDQARLFERFSQIGAPEAGEQAGTGLGLAIAKKLANLMGGDMWVRSAVGQGATFWFTVLVERPDSERTSVPARQEGSGAFRPRSEKKVLLVDDNEINRLVARRMLERLGFEVEAVTNGADAVEAVSRRSYAAVLMDSQMPGMGGNEATAAIRRLEGADKHTPIIALTANAMLPEIERALEAGVDEYLSKPVLLEDLEMALDRVLARSGGVRESARDQPGACGSQHSGDAVLDPACIAELRRIPAQGDQDLLQDLADKIEQDIPAWLEELRAAATEGKLGALKRHAHKMLGVFRQMGALRMGPLCERLEALPQDVRRDEVMDIVGQLDSEFGAFWEEFSVHLASVEPPRKSRGVNPATGSEGDTKTV